MIAGSSALYNEPNNQIVTPKLKVELRQNSYGVSSRGVSMDTEFYSYGKGINFKDKMILGKDVYDTNGTTKLSTVPVGDAYLNLGDTLAAYGGISTLNVQRYYSNNGVSWDSGETLFHGTSVIDALCVTAEDQIYYRKRRGISVLDRVTVNGGWIMHETEIHSRTKDGSTWRDYTIDDDVSFNQGITIQSPPEIRPFQGGHDSVHKLVGARDSNGLDHLYYQYSSDVMHDVYLSGYKVRSTTTDGEQLFEKKTLLENIDKHAGIFQLGNDLAKGLSYYYMPIVVKQPYYTVADKKWGGVTGFDSVNYGVAYLRSPNLKEWSFPILTSWKGVTLYSEYSLGSDSLDDSTSRDDGDENYLYLSPINCVAGSSNEFDFRMAIGLSHRVSGSVRDFFTVFAGSSILDISDDVINYRNVNNERINLTLGNYK